MGDDVVSVSDEFAVTTLTGVPYGVASFNDFADDVVGRILVWCAAQAGADGLGEDNLARLSEEAMILLGKVLAGDLPQDVLGRVWVQRLRDDDV